ncbi:4-(cytidine 5'-diphospho)-2-C-methyl-D-erythritol kinase [Oscillatoriales cyanobacterium LEGE 11467]|uniref:4-diphosphocytidyl-2-C-methyl-D-erythritol kinase n=1 Tax=Zarconia navalis LEGE 11467 TaxID=1828826 RepID=A0A928VXS4_9CYAN|nr:4-(cytidine 5'-diphospho)-2-C-methyl-D-erythritol kinase [Zarconia navalis]MBE9040216.1 4-(cytidine 5'-diphospho)-2-C-methyl-D-erythritol kinase [Zarconia navalis LEGE 11467]
MKSCSLVAPAKINLYLEIIGDRPDGYHELVMVMQSIALADRVELRTLAGEPTRVCCDHPEVPTDDRNLAARAAMLMAQRFPEASRRWGGVEITIDKQIPVAAGLAGGSTDAAATLVGLNLLWDLGLTVSELQDLGAFLGSDVPFCIEGGTALATGRGEKISPLPTVEGLYLVLGKYRSLQVSTAWAYQTFREQFGDRYISDEAGLEERRQRVHSGPMVSAIARHDLSKIGNELYNDLERVVLPVYPQVVQLRDTLVRQGAASGVLGVMMSGSGPSVFAGVESEAQAQRVREETARAIPNPDLELWATQAIPTGIDAISS